MAQEISLRVFGGSLSAGFNRSPLLTVGAVPDGYVPMPPTIVDEQKAWMIAHTQSHTVYSVYTKECKTAEGREGQLLISVFFPAVRRLADGVSPLTLLNTLLDVVSIQLLSDGMLPRTAADPSAFIALLKRYPLEDRSLALPVMAGSSPAAFCAANMSQLDALMRHSRYPSLAKVGLLEIGMHCPTTVNIPVGNKPTKPNQTISSDIKVKQDVHSEHVTPQVKLSDNSDATIDKDIKTSSEHTNQSGGKSSGKFSRIALGILFSAIVFLILLSVFSPKENNGNGDRVSVLDAGLEEESIYMKRDTCNLVVENESETAIDSAAIEAQKNAEIAIEEAEAKKASEDARLAAEKKAAEQLNEFAKKKLAAEAEKEIVRMVNNGTSIGIIRRSQYWSLIKAVNKIDIEWVVDYANKPEVEGAKKKATLKANIRNLLKGKKYKSLAEMHEMRIEIIKLINEFKMLYPGLEE